MENAANSGESIAPKAMPFEALKLGGSRPLSNQVCITAPWRRGGGGGGGGMDRRPRPNANAADAGNLKLTRPQTGRSGASSSNGAVARPEYDDSDDSSAGRYAPEERNPFYVSQNSSSSSQPSYPTSSKSSVHQYQYETPNLTPGMTPTQTTHPGRDYFEPRVGPDGSLEVPRPPSKAIRPASRRSDDSISEVADPRPRNAVAAPPRGAGVAQAPAGHRHQVNEPVAAPEPTVGVTAATEPKTSAKVIKRAKMKLTFQKYVVTVFLLCIK